MTRLSVTVTPVVSRGQEPEITEESVSLYPERNIFLQDKAPLPSFVKRALSKLRWTWFAIDAREFNPSLVAEFLYQAKRLPEGYKTDVVTVRGKKVSFSHEAIKEVLHLPIVPNCPYQGYIESREVPRFVLDIKNLITIGDPVYSKGALCKGILKDEAKFWALFANTNLTPSTHAATVKWALQVQLYCIMKNIPIDAVPLIHGNLKKEIRKTTVCLPCLITKLCLRAGVTTSVDEDLVVGSVIDFKTWNGLRNTYIESDIPFLA